MAGGGAYVLTEEESLAIDNAHFTLCASEEYHHVDLGVLRYG